MSAHQAPLSLGFSRQEHWSGLPFPSPMHESESEVAQSCLTIRDPVDCSLPGSSVHGIFQARVLEWVATAFSVSHSRHPQNNTSQNVNPQNVNLNSRSDSEHISRRKIWHPCSTSLQLEETYSLISRLSVQSPLSNLLDETCIFLIFVFTSQQKYVSISS